MLRQHRQQLHLTKYIHEDINHKATWLHVLTSHQIPFLSNTRIMYHDMEKLYQLPYTQTETRTS